MAGPDEGGGGRHTRRVRPLGRLARGALQRPAVLQDPQVVFPLHDEPVVERAVPGDGTR